MPHVPSKARRRPPVENETLPLKPSAQTPWHLVEATRGASGGLAILGANLRTPRLSMAKVQPG